MKRSIEQAIRAADAIEISSKAATIASHAAAESVIAVRSFPWTILYTTQKPSRNEEWNKRKSRDKTTKGKKIPTAQDNRRVNASSLGAVLCRCDTKPSAEIE
jgi:hypothetical protein